jgi:hypothetical protein
VKDGLPISLFPWSIRHSATVYDCSKGPIVHVAISNVRLRWPLELLAQSNQLSVGISYAINMVHLFDIVKHYFLQASGQNPNCHKCDNAKDCTQDILNHAIAFPADFA